MQPPTRQAPGHAVQALAVGCISHPGLLTRLLICLGGQRSLDGEVRRLLWLDPALGLQLLRVIACSHPHAQLTELDLEQVLARMDSHTIKLLALDGVLQQLSARRDDDSPLQLHWHQAITTAVLCRNLAELSGYRNPQEAWLAGLMTHLPGSMWHAPSPEAARLACLDHLERIPLRSFLPDVLRYLHEPCERLRDAAPLVRLALAAHRLLPGLRQEPVSAPADGVFLSYPLPSETLRDMLQNAQQHAVYLSKNISVMPPQQVAAEVSRFGHLEVTAAMSGHDPEAGIEALATSLAAEEGLYNPIYLALNKRSSTLVSQPLGNSMPPAISLRMEGSNTAAVRALSTHGLVVVYAHGKDTALLDQQIIRRAQAYGLAALPLGEGGSLGVLLLCGDRSALEKLVANARHYTRLGELLGSAPAAPEPPVSVASHGMEQLPARVRHAAHEVSNPLGIIKNYLAILKVKLGDNPPVADELRIIHEELDRIVRILRDMVQDESHNQDSQADVDINLLIADIVKVSAPTLQAKHMQVDSRLGEGLPRLRHNQDRLKQIILNLLLNALEASPPGSRIQVETACVLNQHRQRFLEIGVTDTGPGIPPERVDSLFDPITTDKGAGHAGLGLSIVKQLVESLEGSIRFKTGPGGTTFLVSLPLA